MKKVIAVLISILLVAGIFASCSKGGGNDKEVTMDEQFNKTGVQLILPEAAENSKWFVITEKDGNYPKATFDLNDIHFTYTAKKSDSGELFDNTGLGYEWTDEASWSYDDREGEVHTCDKGGYVCWNDVDYLFTVFADGAKEDDLFMVADEIFLAEIYYAEENADGNIPPEEGEEEWTEEQLTGWELGVQLWKYEDEDRYLRISANRTYTECGADRTPDEKIRFWKVDEKDENKIILLDENGNEKNVVTVTGDSEYCMLTDKDGKQLSMSNDIMNGEYSYYASDDYYADEELFVVAYVDFWVSDEQAKTLKEGDVIRCLDEDTYDIAVESVEKVDEDHLVINGETDLEYQSEAGAWRITNPASIPMEAAGVCFVLEDTVFTDNADEEAHENFVSCLASHDGIYGVVTVKDGVAAEITVEEVL